MIKKLLDKLAKEEKQFLSQNIFAPYVKGSTDIRVRVNNVIYKFNIAKKKKDGFGIFKAVNPNSASLVRQAEQNEIDEYLALFPKVDMILVYNIGRWVGYPLNMNEFKHRFKIEPKISNILMVDNAEMLDSAVTRFDGINLWFESIKFGNNAERMTLLRNRILQGNYSIAKDLQSGITPEEGIAFKFASEFHKQATMSDLEKKLHTEFKQVNAKVDRFVERGGNVEVQWVDEKTNQTFTSVFNKDTLNVVTAGICLSGGDKKFDLKSLVSVCREGHRRHNIVHVGNGGMDERAYRDMYGDGEQQYEDYDDDY